MQRDDEKRSLTEKRKPSGLILRDGASLELAEGLRWGEISGTLLATELPRGPRVGLSGTLGPSKTKNKTNT